MIDARNAEEKGSAQHGITKFADLTQDEFKAHYLNRGRQSDDAIWLAEAVQNTKERRNLILAGFSETRALVRTLVRLVDCKGADLTKDGACTMHLEWAKRRNTSFLATCRNRLPLVSFQSCRAHSC